MNRIAGRAWALLLMIAILLGGTGFFLYEYSTQAHNWVMHSGSPHVYEDDGKTIALGTVVDRDGNFLLDMDRGRTYSTDPAVRMSTVHWLGDRSGYIYAPFLSHYAKEMTGYDRINGIYHYGLTGGQTTLTLSRSVQVAALAALGDRKGTVAVYNYKTGELLCAVTTPTYDPENIPDFSADTQGTYEGVYLNRFLQAAYIPGSIFKLVTTAAALESIPDIREQTFTCTGTYSFGNDKVTCEIAHGTLNLKTAMLRSCNCTYAQVAIQLGRQNMAHYVDAYGVTKPIAFDGMTTVKGNFDVKNAASVELAWSAIGQHKDQINPCAFLAFVGAVANGGQGVAPYVVKSVRVGNEITYLAPVTALSRVMPAEIAAELASYMRNNVAKYYGDENFHGLTVCAKSGTGEVGGGQKPNAMFTGFVTDEEYPLAFIVCVENGGYGRTTCIPIISKVLEQCKIVLDEQ